MGGNVLESKRFTKGVCFFPTRRLRDITEVHCMINICIFIFSFQSCIIHSLLNLENYDFW